MVYKSLADLIKPQEEEPKMSLMDQSQQDRLMIPAAQSEIESPMIPNETPQEMQQPTQAPMMAEAEPSQPQAVPMSKSEALLADYNKLLGKSQEDLAEARRSDRMLKIGGALGDALATYLNAQSQMNVKAPGVQVQQGAGLGKVADMFATAPEIQSDVAARREAMMKQYAELSKGERSQARLTSEEKLAKDRMTQQKELTQKEIDARLEAARIGSSGKGKLTPYQQLMEDRYQEKATKLSDKQTKEIEGLDNVLSSLNEVESAKTGVNTGRYAAAGQKAIDLIPGMEADQNFVALRQMSGTQLFDYVKEQSGVSYSVKELEELKNNMPNIADDDKTFITKLDTVRKIVERKRQNKLGAFEKQGKNVKEFKQEQSQETKTHPVTGVMLKKVPGGWEEVD